MGRFAIKYTPEQKRALVCAVIDSGMNVPFAVKAASEGKLHGVKAFDMPISTARSYVRDEKARRLEMRKPSLAKLPPGEAARSAMDRLWGYFGEELDRIDRKPQSQRAKEIDRMAKVAASMNRAEMALQNRTEKQTPGKQETKDSSAGAEQPSTPFVSGLARKVETAQEGDPKRSDNNRDEHAQRNSGVETPEQPTATKDQRAADFLARSRAAASSSAPAAA